MSKPFTIRIYVPDGDSEGVRIIDRLSSTGTFIAFPREQYVSVKNRSELKSAGVYFLSGYKKSSDELPTIYIGQADVLKNRIEQHLKQKDFWDRAIVFVSENKLNGTHAKWLEQALIQKAIEVNRSILDNGNSPNEPNISEAEKSEMNVFLEEIYQTLPLAGFRAFEVPKVISPIVNNDEKDVTKKKNTIIVPANEGGFKKVFLGENAWYAIRISGGKLNDIEYIAGYQTMPVAAITHYAKVDHIEPFGEDGKYKVVFADNAIELENKIPFGSAKQGSMQSIRYTNFDKLKNAKEITELFDK